jgi:hypothetical protein
MKNLTQTIHFCDISQSFVSATKYENTSTLKSLLYYRGQVLTILTFSHHVTPHKYLV